MYKAWQGALNHFPRLTRYTLGSKIDLLFCDVLENILLAAYSPRNEKFSFLRQANMKFDALKFFLTMAWELKYIETKKFGALSAPLSEVGKMLGKWMLSVKEHS